MANSSLGFHITFGICFCVFFIIGLPMWLVGCNPDVPNGCITRSIESANVTSVDVKSGVCCSSCKCGKSTCCCGGYSCYSTSVGLDTSKGHCTGFLNGVYRNSNDANNAGRAVGPTTQAVIDPRSLQCSIYLRDYWNIWVAGVFFLALTACCTLTWLCFCCCDACFKEKSPDPVPLEMTTTSDPSTPSTSDPYNPSNNNNNTGGTNPYPVGTNPPIMYGGSNLTTYNTPYGGDPSQPQMYTAYNTNPYPQPQEGQPQQGYPPQMIGYNNNPQMIGYNNNPQMVGYNNNPYQHQQQQPPVRTPDDSSGPEGVSKVDNDDDAPPAYDDAPPPYEGEQRAS